MRGEERELLTLLPNLSYRAIRFSRQTDRQTSLGYRERERIRENEAFNLVTERVSPVYIYIYTYLIDKGCKIYSTCTCTCTSYRKPFPISPKVAYVSTYVGVYVLVCTVYICV